MQIYSNTKTIPQTFTSRFNLEDYQTKRSLQALNRMLAEKRDGAELYDSFIKKVELDGSNDVFDFHQFYKYFDMINVKTNRVTRFHNRTLIKKLLEFINGKL
ncbi:MAG: hypothetical protein NC191_02610 [Muribaculaceae bacterium]|nr:hypothetical protein [Muribaculaceae bacterium]